MTDVIQLELPFQETITGYVYTLTFPGGYTYVGSTTRTVTERIGSHISEIKQGSGCLKLIEMANLVGFECVVQPDTRRKRWQFRRCQVSSKKYTVANRKELRQHENRTIRFIPYHLRLNQRGAYLKSEDNDFTIPVSCQAWVDMLYPEQSEQRVDAAA